MVPAPQICDRDQELYWPSRDNQKKWSEIEECFARADQGEEKDARKD